MRSGGDRADAVENRSKLLAAVGRLLSERGEATLSEVAVEAGVSRATTYRNFSSIDDAVLAYVAAFLDDFEQAAADVTGVRAMCAAWGRLVAHRGHALVHVRSTEGFLARVRRHDDVISRIDRVVRRSIGDDPELEIPDDRMDLAIFVWNALLDPRELLDLADHDGSTVEHATEKITDLVMVALRALEHRHSSGPPTTRQGGRRRSGSR